VRVLLLLEAAQRRLGRLPQIIVRLQLKGFAIVLPRPFGIPLSLPGFAAGEKGADIFRVDPDGFVGV